MSAGITRLVPTDDDGTGTTGTVFNAAYLAALYQSIEDAFTATSYTPTWTGSGGNPAIGNGTLSGRYWRVNKIIFYDIYIVPGSTTTFGSGSYEFALPVTAADTNGQTGTAMLEDISARNWQCMTRLSTTSKLQILPDDASGAGMTPTAPFTLASGDKIRITGWYFAA